MILTKDLSPQVCRVTETQPVARPCICPSSAWGVECVSCSISSANYVPASSPNTIASQREPVFAWVSSILRVLNWPQGPHLAGISPVDCFLCLLWFCDVGTPCFFPQGCLPPSLVRSPGVHGKVSCALGVEGPGGAAVLEHHRTVSSSPPADEWFCQVQLASSEVVLFLLSAPSVVSLLRLRLLPGPQIGELNKCPLS